jgi:hypothetical protein
LPNTLFSTVYNRFLGLVTDDMYLELTPEDTIKDLQNLLIAAIPGFEFPRQNLFDYSINVIELSQEELVDDDFVLGIAWNNDLLDEPAE